jgi:hypothetical protein
MPAEIPEVSIFTRAGAREQQRWALLTLIFSSIPSRPSREIARRSHNAAYQHFA